MSDHHRFAPLPAISTGLAGRCPRCGEGRLFDGLLAVGERCRACDLDYTSFDPGDGPAVFVILIVGFVVVGGALAVEVSWQPPFWLHALLWFPLGAILPLYLLRKIKGVLIALEFKHQAAEGRLADSD